MLSTLCSPKAVHASLVPPLHFPFVHSSGRPETYKAHLGDPSSSDGTRSRCSHTNYSCKVALILECSRIPDSNFWNTDRWWLLPNASVQRQCLRTQFGPSLTLALPIWRCVIKFYKHDPGNHIKYRQTTVWVSKLTLKLFLDSEYYNCDYIGLKQCASKWLRLK